MGLIMGQSVPLPPPPPLPSLNKTPLIIDAILAYAYTYLPFWGKQTDSFL